MPSSSVTRGRSASPIRAKFEAFHASQDGVISPLVFYNFAIEIGVLVPLDVIVTLFKEVDANNDGSIDLDEFLSFIMETDLELKMNPKQIVMKRLLCDPYFWPIAFYLPAGIFFMLGSFFSYKEDPGDFWMASYIVAHIFYIIQPLITLVSYPIELWSNEIEDEKLAQTFKKIILQNANKQSDDLLSEKTDNLTIARYIQEEYFGDGKRFLTKADVEKILIAHMGAVAEEAVVDSIFGRLDVGGQRKIYPDEILLFSMKNHHSVSPLGRLWKTAKTLLGDIGYWLNAVFVVALTLGIVQYATMIEGRGLMDDFKLISWLWLVGTSSFLYQNYKGKKKIFRRIKLCKVVLEKFALIAPFLLGKSSTWNEFEKEGLDWQGLRSLLEESGISLSDKLLSHVFNLIDKSATGTVSKSELDSFVNSRMGATSTTFLLCITSYNFWADCSWSIASISYICASYLSDSFQIQVFDNIGSVFFFLGAFPLMYGCWEDARVLLNNEHILIKELQRRCGSGKYSTPGILQMPKAEQRNITAENDLYQQSITVNAGATFSIPFTVVVQSVHVDLATAGHSMDASIELKREGKRTIEIHVSTEDGRANNFNTTIHTRSSESEVTITNKGSNALTAVLEPRRTDVKQSESSLARWRGTSFRAAKASEKSEEFEIGKA